MLNSSILVLFILLLCIEKCETCILGEWMISVCIIHSFIYSTFISCSCKLDVNTAVGNCTLLMVALCVPRQGERIMECWRNTFPGKSTVKNCYAVSKIKYQISPGDWCYVEISDETSTGFTSECKFPMIWLQGGVMFWVLWHIWNGHKEREYRMCSRSGGCLNCRTPQYGCTRWW